MAVRLPPMQALRAFEAAAREGSLTRAAHALHVTHGAISHQIKALESDLGVRLIERSRARHPPDRRGRALREPRARRVRRAHLGGARDHGAREPAAAARERGAVVRRALAAAAHRPLSGRPPGCRSRRARQHGERRFPARRRGRRDPLRPRRLAGRDGRAPARRRVRSGLQPAHRERTHPETSGRSGALHAAAIRRRALEAVVRGGRPRLARACARTDVQRFVTHDAGRRGGPGRRAGAAFAPGQRRAQRHSGPAVRHRGARRPATSGSSILRAWRIRRSSPCSGNGCTTRSGPMRMPPRRIPAAGRPAHAAGEAKRASRRT